MPNTSGINYNLQMTAPTTHSNTWQTVTRVDYQASSKLRISAKYAGQNGTVQLNPGTMPGYNDTVFQFPAILVPSATVDYTINTTTIFEGTWGLTQGNQLGNVMADSVTNRNNVGLGNLPTLYPNNGAVDPSFYQAKVLAAMKAPFYQNGSILMAPGFTWGGSSGRVGVNGPPALIYPTFLCSRTRRICRSASRSFGATTPSRWGTNRRTA